MTLEEAVLFGHGERFTYPAVIDDKAGLGEHPSIGATGIPSWNRGNPTKKRKILLKVTTFRGICSNAVHYYGAILADGVYSATTGNLEKPLSLSFAQEKEFPLLNFRYVLKLRRYVTKEEIERSPQDWEYCDAGDLTERFLSVQQLVLHARELISLRFEGDWALWLSYPNGKTIPLGEYIIGE